MTKQIHQGHPYACGQHTYIAMNSGTQAVLMAQVDRDALWPLHKPIVLHSSQLTPLPCRYLHGDVK